MEYRDFVLHFRILLSLSLMARLLNIDETYQQGLI